MTEEEIEALKKVFGSPQPEEKQNVHTFLNKVAEKPDTTRVGYVKEEELGTPPLTIRTLKELSLISDKIMDNDFFKKYYEARSEIVTSTSLSKEAMLIKLAVVQRREIADVTPEKKVNKGWFKRRKNPEPVAQF